jgi:hypothetical protein
MPSFVSEPITVLNCSFDTAGMACGEPGLPQQFRWRKTDYTVADVLEKWKEHGDCSNGSGERYVRRHAYRVRATDGTVLNLYCIRSFGRGKAQTKSRWWLRSVELPEAQSVPAPALAQAA